MNSLNSEITRTQHTHPSGAIAVKEMSFFKMVANHYKRQQFYTSVMFLLIPIILLVIFTYIPVANMIGYSFAKWDGLGDDQVWVGLENYVELFTRPELFRVFGVSIYYLGGAILQIAIALYFATILSFDAPFKSFFRGVLFFPYLINGVAIGFAFLYFFRPEGVLDALLAAVGLESAQQLWLGNRSFINISLAFVSIWRYLGLNFVIFLGAIQSIPDDIFEASEIDGASRWQQFFLIILPIIMPVISLSLLLAIRGALSVFEIPYIMTGGANGSETFVIQTVNMAFKYKKFGLASAMSVVLLAISLVVASAQQWLIKGSKYEN